ncbi:hypothetical protein JW756_00335 [Candidatus Woesearchaeota archaeon]|nr:hypothetical protein [Candidatus Woesearchaeota archaeon]
MREKLILLGLLALFGVFLLRGGMTGSAIAEQCSSDENCLYGGASLEQPAYLTLEDSQALSYVGLLVVIISSALVFGYLRKKAWQEKSQNNSFDDA